MKCVFFESAEASVSGLKKKTTKKTFYTLIKKGFLLLIMFPDTSNNNLSV